MSGNSILAFDVGTTSVKAGILDAIDFRVLAKLSVGTDIEYPRSGWAEQDPDKLWNQLADLARRLLEEEGVNQHDIAGIVYTAHMAGVLPISRDGDPLRNIIIWLDERAAGLPDKVWSGLLRIQGYNLFRLIKFLRATGGAPSKTGKDPISKMVWIRENEPDVYNKTSKFIDVKGYLIYRSTGSIVTSHDEAHLTWLANTRGNMALWDDSLLRDYGFSRNQFPEIRDSTALAGRLVDEAAMDLGLDPGLPVIVGCGDITAAAVGSGAIGEGETHIYIGTSDWIAAHIGKRKVDVSHYIGSLLSGIPGRYLLIAEQEVAAGALEWAMRLLGYDEGDYRSVEIDIKSSPPSSRNLIFFPWLYGERAPIDDPYVRGGLINFTFTHDKGDILRAIMEGVAMNIKWAFEYFQKIVGPKSEVNIVGGGALFDVWCQILADMLRVRLRRIRDPQDAGLRGLATIASVALGTYESFEEAVSRYTVDRSFEPNIEASAVYDKLYREFNRFYERNKKLFKALNIHG